MPRILLCASAAHCAHILLAASRLQLPLHNLQPCTTWPSDAQINAASHLLWAQVPPADTIAQAIENEWRTTQLPHTPAAVQMLYGSPQQQAQQLSPWVPQIHPPQATSHAHCYECLDARSEQQLFQHLIARSTQPHSLTGTH